MIKEFIVAITLGALLGFGLTGGFYAVQKNATQSREPVPTPVLADTTSDTSGPASADTSELSTQNHSLTVETPENNYLTNSAKLTIKGSTTPGSLIIITTPADIFSGRSDNAGNFDIDIELESGANLITVESINSQDDQAKTELLVTFSTAKI